MPSVEARNVNHPEYQENLNEAKYTLVREAILASLPAEGGRAGLTFEALEVKVAAYLARRKTPAALFPKPGSVRWYTKAVQLDLEARGLIERVPGQSPLRLRRP